MSPPKSDALAPLPPCGLYRTTESIGSVPAERLVYFHNHGDPGPGIYLPDGWTHNRATFRSRGVTLTEPDLAQTLAPLPREGFYVVLDRFWCCHKQCREFQPDELVQLGYNGQAEPILFLPELVDGALGIPSMGTKTDLDVATHLRRLTIRESRGAARH